MRYVIENIEAEQLPRELRQRGIEPRQRLRVVLQTLNDDLPMGQIAEAGGGFAFLQDEPDLYTEADLLPPDA